MNSVNYSRPLITCLKRLCVFVVFLLVSTDALAQRYTFHNLNVDDGLVQSQATCLTQDLAGNLWIGTLGGLSRYDGKNFTNYTVRNGLQSNAVWSVAVDSQGSIWIGGQLGISEFNGSSFRHYRKQMQTARTINSTQQIQVVRDTTWWRVQGDVYFISKGKIKFFVTPGPQGFVSALLAEKEGLWIAKDGIIYHQAGTRWDTLRFALPPEQSQPNITRIYRDKEGMVWVATNAGLFKIDHGQLVDHPVNEVPLQMLPVISSITPDKSGAIWLGTNSGVLKISENVIQQYNKQNGLSDNNFFDMITDRDGNVWMASDGQGVFRFSGTQFSVLDETMGLPSAQVIAMASNNSDSLFLGTYDAGLYIFNEGTISAMDFPSRPVPAITSLCYTHNSKLWIGTRGRGLWSYHNEIFRQYEAPERHFPSNFIQCLYEDPMNRLWIGFANGAIVYANDSFKTVVSENKSIVSFLTIGNDSVLIATDRKNGLLLYSGGNVSEFSTNTIVDSSTVQCFILKKGELWMGTSDNGVLRYNMSTKKAEVINKINGLRSDFIYNIINDNDGNVWVGTGFGIHKIKTDTEGKPQITFYGKAQGVTGMESNINAVLKLPDGSIWFGTTNGALHYQPHTPVVSSAPSSIVLQSVKLTGENTIDPAWYDSTDTWYGTPYHLRLPYKKNNIAFSFQAITLSGAQQVLYRYHLDGLETPWSDWSTINSVTYSALPPGKYVFRVQCRSGEDQNNPELTYSFEIITPFQQTSWFRLAVLVACLLAGILIQYLVNSRKERRSRLMAKMRREEQAKIRLRTAEDFHDEIGNKLTRINVLTNVLKNKITLTPDTTRILGQIEDNTSQLYSGTRDILWSLKPSNDNLYEILHRIRDFAGELFQDTDFTFTFKGTDEKWRKHRLPLDMSRNLIMIFKEALNNCLKYSKAKNVSLEVTLKNRNVLQMVLKDDGEGFDIQTIKKGNGLNNMNVRAERLNGRLYIDSRKGKGTIINLTFKIPLNR
jgi:ligand-binding sensor domain-containing protein/signal transduction histidine kinase